MTNPLAQDLGGVVRLLEKFNAGAFSHQERIDFEHACVEFIRTHSAEIAGALACAREYDELIRHMDAGGDFYDFQRKRSAIQQGGGGGDHA